MWELWFLKEKYLEEFIVVAYMVVCATWRKSTPCITSTLIPHGIETWVIMRWNSNTNTLFVVNLPTKWKHLEKSET
jgi:hypothetical protein